MVTEKEYLQAFRKFVDIHHEMMKSTKNNPFQLEDPLHKGLKSYTIMKDDEYNRIIISIQKATEDQKEFQKILSIGNAIIEKVKYLLLM